MKPGFVCLYLLVFFVLVGHFQWFFPLFIKFFLYFLYYNCFQDKLSKFSIFNETMIKSSMRCLPYCKPTIFLNSVSVWSCVLCLSACMVLPCVLLRLYGKLFGYGCGCFYCGCECLLLMFHNLVFGVALEQHQRMSTNCYNPHCKKILWPQNLAIRWYFQKFS